MDQTEIEDQIDLRQVRQQAVANMRLRVSHLLLKEGARVVGDRKTLADVEAIFIPQIFGPGMFPGCRAIAEYGAARWEATAPRTDLRAQGCSSERDCVSNPTRTLGPRKPQN